MTQTTRAKAGAGKRQPSFGQMIRGLRLGFGWSRALGRFVRVSGSGPFLVEIRSFVDNSDRAEGKHREWWGADGGDPLLLTSPTLAAMAEHGAPARENLTLDDAGQRVA